MLPISNTQARSLAGKRWALNGQVYYFKDYDQNRGQPPWRSGSEGKAYPLLDSKGQATAYLKFFTVASPERYTRTLWLIQRRIHSWAAPLAAAPSAWVDCRQDGRPAGVGFDFTGYLATAAHGETWLELKYRLCEKGEKFQKSDRWQCVRDLVSALAALERAGIIHGDLSPQNILVDGSRLSIIDFDAFVARTGGLTLALSVAQGGTYGTQGYCPPDLVKQAEAGNSSVAPYSDRHSRDMLMLELLLACPDFSSESPPSDWDRARVKRRFEAFLSTADPVFHPAIMHLHPDTVFALPELQRPSSMVLANALGCSLPPPPTQPAAVIIQPRPVPAPVQRPLPPAQTAASPQTLPPAAVGKPRTIHARLVILIVLVLVAAFAGFRAIQAYRTYNPSAPPDMALELTPTPAAPVVVPAPLLPEPTPAPVIPPTRTSAGDYSETHNRLNLAMVWIPAGSFQMGSNSSSADSDEKPVHTVALDGFWIGKSEVTQRQYEALIGSNPSNFRGPDKPVENVSWDDAMAFCRTLSAATGLTYTLPSEAQWEYACRAGSATEYCFGDDTSGLGNYAWYSGNSGSQTHDVGGRAANAWGLYDMHGNVWEWCADWYGPYGASAQRNPTGAASGQFRVIRGGYWRSHAYYCRSAYRYYNTPDSRSSDIGFRFVRTQK